MTPFARPPASRSPSLFSGVNRSGDDSWGPARARIVAGVLGLMFVLIVGRTAQIAMSGADVAALAPSGAEIVRRADIVDRNGDLLATSLPAWSLSADPRAIWDAREIAEGVATALPGIDVDDLAARLSDTDRRFVWIQRGLTPRQRQAVFELGLEGLHFEEEMRRVYPGGRLAGHLLGFTNVDGKGVEGLERAFEARLVSGGEPLRLTIDAGVQFALESELDRASQDYDMIGAAGVVIDASTGAVRAIASWPAVDPNQPSGRVETAMTDRASNAVFELGSVFKPFTVAAALEAGVLEPADAFDVSLPLKIGAVNVRDTHALPHPQAVTATDILAYSSNIGTVQIAQRLGPDAQRAFLGRLGLLKRVETEGTASAAPLTPAAWDALTSATVSYGHGLAVSPLALAAAFTSFANNGVRLPPRFLEPVDPADLKPETVMSPATARRVVDMMRETVRVGSGKLADAPGYQVAGKTGTAEKPGPDGYDPDRNVTSFAAVFPASRPQFVVLVVLDEAKPKVGDARTAAYTSAAIVGRLIARAAPMLDVEPVMGEPAADSRALEAAAPRDGAVDAQPELRTGSESRAL